MVDEAAREKWERRYAQDSIGSSPEPANVLSEYAHLLPESGTALDLACGRGGNALFLARRGFKVHAWDISKAAIDGLGHQAKSEGLEIKTCECDVNESPPSSNMFDVICVSFYLERAITTQIMEALKPQGLLFYQTFTHERVTDQGPSNPSYLLGPNELLELFAPLHVLAYREEGRTGNLQQGLRETAWLVAQRRRGELA